MNLLLQRLLHAWEALHVTPRMRWLVWGVYGWHVWNSLTLWPHFELIWGNHSVFQRLGHVDGAINNIVYHLVYTKRWSALVFHAHWMLAILAVFRFPGRMVVRAIVWITGIMLFFSAIEVFNSGMMIMNLMAFYLIFYDESRGPSAWSNKVVYLMGVAQVIIVYAVSAFYKLRGEQWLEGDILFFVLQTPHFVSDAIRDSGLISWKILLAALSYFALAYQLLFPLLVFVRRWRWIWIGIGVAFHLSIALFMHLYDFGFAMIVCYALFVPLKNNLNS